MTLYFCFCNLYNDFLTFSIKCFFHLITCPLRSLWTWFHTCSSGFNSGLYHGIKYIFISLFIEFKYLFTFFVLCIGWPSNISVFFFLSSWNLFKNSINSSLSKLHSYVINLISCFGLTTDIQFTPNLAHVDVTTGVSPFFLRVFRWFKSGFISIIIFSSLYFCFFFYYFLH